VIRWSVWGRQAGQGQQATLWRHLADVRAVDIGWEAAPVARRTALWAARLAARPTISFFEGIEKS
jgi:hypothetical protein